MADTPDGELVFRPNADGERFWDAAYEAITAAIERDTVTWLVSDGRRSAAIVPAARLADKDAEISRLTAELDGLRNVTVELVPTAGIEAAMAADPDREDGTVLREMGGQKRAWAWKAATREWEQIA